MNFYLEQARAMSRFFLSYRFVRGRAASGLLGSARSSLTAPSEVLFGAGGGEGTYQ